MNTKTKLILGAISAVLCLLASGCSTAEMKGTPFYSGEYGKRRGPAEQRVNAWPIFYFRDPALSVLWPIFERTDDHTAVRPLFSIYGQDESKPEYNVLWPLAQFDRRTRDNRVIPLFWGHDYSVAFPLYWHFDEPFGAAGGTDSLFPLWILNRHGTNELDLWGAWPLFHCRYDLKAGEQSSMVFPLYFHERDRDESRFISLPWMSGSGPKSQWQMLTPLFYHTSNATHSALITPLWGHWKTGERETYLAPWLLSWETHRPQRDDLWFAGGLAHASWGEKGGSHYAVPFYFRDADDHTLLTPLFGWNEQQGYFYPLTPLAGIRTNKNTGSWLFPIFSHKRSTTSGNVTDNFLLLGGYSQRKQGTHSWFYPLFDFSDHGPVDSTPEAGRNYGHYGKDFWCLPWCWYENLSDVRPVPKAIARVGNAAPDPAGGTNAAPVRTYHFRHGAFPFWSHAETFTPAQGKSTRDSCVLLLLYDYKKEINPATTKGAATNYTRARVCWRLWHYERLNDDVSVDVFPGFTYDRKKDGYQKTSLLWRVFRSERSARGAKKLDVLFVPLKR